MPRRLITQAMRRINRVIPTSWLARFLPIHFTKRGATIYKYQPRAGEKGSNRPFKGSYTQRKLRRRGHTRPLEDTGRGKSDAFSNQRVTSTRKRASAVMRAPVFNFRPHMVREITTVLESENDQLDHDATKKTDAELRRAGRRHTGPVN